MSCREMHISSGHVRDILLIGIPASITNLMQSFAVLLTNRFLLPYGSDKVAALGIALKVNMITMLILVGFAFGAQPLLGYCYGADNRERLKQFLHFDLLVQLLIALVFTAAACIFAPPIIRIFMQDDVIVVSGALMLRCLMITAPVIGMILVFTTLFQAAGMALPAFLMSISRQGVLLVLCMLLLFLPCSATWNSARAGSLRCSHRNSGLPSAAQIKNTALMRRASHRLCAAVNLLKRISCGIMLPDVNNHRTDGHGRLYVIREQGNLLLVQRRNFLCVLLNLCFLDRHPLPVSAQNLIEFHIAHTASSSSVVNNRYMENTENADSNQ